MTNKKTLLIVDDSKVSRMMINKLVNDKQPEWELVEAASGEEAIKICEQQEVDYFSIDLNMPNMDGLELIERLQPKYQRSKMVLLTANVQQTVEDKATQHGVVCVHKPITEECIGKILEILNA